MDDLVGKKHARASQDRFDQALIPISLVAAVQTVCMTIPAGNMVTAKIVAELIRAYVSDKLTLDEVRDKTPTF